MTTKTPQLRDLGEFLKIRRSELTPGEVGLPALGTGRRRGHGLRREEVAQLVTISPDYYMRIEQGRLAPSTSVLSAVARALRLDPDQTKYVESLVGRTGPRRQPRRRTKRVTVHPHLARLLGQIDGMAAMVLGPRLDILAWNPLAVALYVDFGALPDRERDYVRLVFTNAEMRALYADWEKVARRGVEFLRMEAGENPTDPALTALVGELSIADQQFREWWASHRVAHQDFGRKVLNHPMVGELTLDWDTFRYAGAPEQQLLLWSADPASPSYERLQQLAGDAASDNNQA